MSLELLREALKVNQIIGEESTKTVVENDIIVPDVKPDVANILMADGDVFIKSAETMQEKVLVSGVINYKVMYLSDDEDSTVKSINYNSNFSYALEVSDTKQGMKCKAKCDIEHIDCEIINGRKIGLKTILSVNGKVYNEVVYELASDLRGLDDLQILKSKADVNAYLGDNEAFCSINEKLEVPPGKPTIREILRNDAKVVAREYKITENRVLAKGELNISTLYIGDDENNSIQFMEHAVPFTQFVDLDGIDEGSQCEVDFRITDLLFEASEDNDGELRVLSGDVGVGIYVSAYRKASIEIIEDAYSPAVRLTLEKEPFAMEEVAAENKAQVVVKDNIGIDNDQPEIAELFNVISKPALSDYKVMDDKVLVEGVVTNNVLYLANDNQQPVFCQQQEMPFKQMIDVKGIKADMNCEIVLEVDHTNYSLISSNEIEIRIALGVTVKGMSMVTIPVIAKVIESPVDEKRLASRPSIIIYFAQPGDNLWKVAKKYSISVDDIQRANGFTERDSITSGQQIIIPRRV